MAADSIINYAFTDHAKRELFRRGLSEQVIHAIRLGLSNEILSALGGSCCNHDFQWESQRQPFLSGCVSMLIGIRLRLLLLIGPVRLENTGGSHEGLVR